MFEISDPQKPTILVSGANGFVGRTIVEYFQNSGDWNVLATDRKPNNYLEGLRVGDFMDLARHPNFFDGVSLYVHSMVDIRPGYRKAEIRLRNTKALELSLEKSKRASVKRFMLISSSAAIPSKLWSSVPDSITDYPRDPYGVVRNEMERLTLEAADRQFTTTVLRPHIVLGQGRAGVFQKFIDDVKLGKVVFIPQSLTAPQHVVHVKDLARAVMYAHDTNLSGVANIGCRIVGAPKDYLEMQAKRFGYRTKFHIVPSFITSPIAMFSDLFGLNFFGPNRPLLSPVGFVFGSGHLVCSKTFQFEYSEEESWASIFRSSEKLS